MVLNKLTKKCIYPKQHSWTVMSNKALSAYIRKSTFGIDNHRSTSSFNGFQLSKVQTNNVTIAIVDENTGNLIASVRGTIDDINRTFVHSFNKSANLDPQFNQYCYKRLIEYLIGKPNATHNQIMQYLSNIRYKGAKATSGVSYQHINQCVARVNALYKLIKGFYKNYTIDQSLINVFDLKNVDWVLCTKSYLSKTDKLIHDKKTINDRRYRQSNNSKIVNTILHKRLAEKHVLPIRFDIKANSVYVWDNNSKVKNNTILTTQFPVFAIQGIEWNSSLTTATINLGSKYSIVVKPTAVDVIANTTSKSYGYNAFKGFLVTEQKTTWPTSFKNNTNQFKNVLAQLNTKISINKNVNTIDGLERVYQELDAQSQIDCVSVLRMVCQIFDTLGVDNIDVFVYYLLGKDSNEKPNVIIM